MSAVITEIHTFFDSRGSFNEEEFYNSEFCAKLKTDGANVFQYLPEAGWWKCLSPSQVSSCLLGLFPAEIRGKVPLAALVRVAKKIIIDPSHLIDFEVIADKGRFLVNASNGVVRVKAKQFVPHNPDYMFTYRLNFNYDPDADITMAEAFNKFCRTSLDGSQDAKLRLLQMIGYCISSLEGAEKMFVFLGPSNCGKSVILNLLERIIGSANVTAFPLSTVTDARNIVELRYARANINRELTGARIAQPDILKSLISNEVVSGERKFCNPEKFRNHAKLCFAGNALPQLWESDEANKAILNRLCVLRFPRSLSDEEKDTGLLKALMNEVDVIASVAVNTLSKLIADNYSFHEDPLSGEFMDVYESYSQILEQFVSDRLELNPKMCIHTADILSQYKKFCTDNGFDNTSSKREISNYIAALQGVKRDKFRLNGSPPLCGFRGVGLKP